MRTKSLAILFGVFLTLGLVGSAGALELLTNGGFETGNLTGWAASNTAVLGSHLGVNPNEGSFMAVLGPLFGLGNASLSQGFNAGGLPGTVSFDYNLQSKDILPGFDFGTDRLRVSIDGTTLVNVALNDVFGGGTTILGWQTFSQFFAAIPAGPLTISFDMTNLILSGGNPDLFSAYVDDVSVSVPEPSALLLLGSGLAGLGFLRRSRKQPATLGARA